MVLEEESIVVDVDVIVLVVVLEIVLDDVGIVELKFVDVGTSVKKSGRLIVCVMLPGALELDEDDERSKNGISFQHESDRTTIRTSGSTIFLLKSLAFCNSRSRAFGLKAGC